MYGGMCVCWYVCMVVHVSGTCVLLYACMVARVCGGARVRWYACMLVRVCGGTRVCLYVCLVGRMCGCACVWLVACVVVRVYADDPVGLMRHCVSAFLTVVLFLPCISVCGHGSLNLSSLSLFIGIVGQ